MANKILVTPRSVTRGGHPQLERLRAAGSEVVFCTPGKQPAEDELVALAPGCVGYLAGVEPVTARVLDAAADLKVISRNGVGVDNIDAEAAQRKGITVCRAVGANSRGVAELALASILALARAIPYSDAAIKAGGWKRRNGIELARRTLGLVGCGQIGKLVAKFALALDMHVVAFDPFPDPKFAPGGAFSYVSLAKLIQSSDVISLHCPSQPDKRPVLDRDAFAGMKGKVLIVNTARADLIDRAALAEALQSGKVAGAALDVFATEPPTDDPLLKDDRVIATPHVGGLTDESVDRAIAVAVDNLLNHLRKEH